jgi:hypothetical protein
MSTTNPYISGAIIMLIGFLISLATVTQVQQENTSTEAQPPAKRFA